MTFPLYPDYKDSEMPWPGKVPSHWQVGPLKHFFRSYDARRSPLSGEERAGRAGPYPYYGASGIIDYIDKFLFDEDLILVAEDGANLVSRVTPIAFVASGKYWVNNHAHILKPIDKNMLFWSLCIESIDVFPFVTGSAQPKLTSEALGALTLAVPPPDERNVINNFLTIETSKIDALVAEQLRLIELLKEKRQAVISHAVTKGLNADAPMKPSGIEWLGDVPAHWELTPLKYLVELRSGGTPSKSNLKYWNGDIPWASSKDLKAESLSDTIDHISPTAIEDAPLS